MNTRQRIGLFLLLALLSAGVEFSLEKNILGFYLWFVGALLLMI